MTHNGCTYRIEQGENNRFEIYIDGKRVHAGRSNQGREHLIKLAKSLIDARKR